MKNNGVKDGELSIDDEALRNIVRLYTREAGVRAVERLISKICRKVVKELLTSKDITRVDVTVDNLDKYLGVYQFRYGRAEEKNQIGQRSAERSVGKKCVSTGRDMGDGYL